MCVLQDSDSKDYKLWVWYGKEGSPYPLIGESFLIVGLSVFLPRVKKVFGQRILVLIHCAEFWDGVYEERISPLIGFIFYPAFKLKQSVCIKRV